MTCLNWPLIVSEFTWPKANWIRVRMVILNSKQFSRPMFEYKQSELLQTDDSEHTDLIINSICPETHHKHIANPDHDV